MLLQGREWEGGRSRRNKRIIIDGNMGGEARGMRTVDASFSAQSGLVCGTCAFIDADGASLA